MSKETEATWKEQVLVRLAHRMQARMRKICDMEAYARKRRQQQKEPTERQKQIYRLHKASLLELTELFSELKYFK